MNFFDLRNGIISGGNLVSTGKYELKGGEKTYPTYSAQAINAATLDVLNGSEPPVSNVLEAYKETFDNLFLPAYKQLLGKNVEVNSVSAYQKMLIYIADKVKDLKWEIDIHYVPAEGKSVYIETDDGTNYILVDWGDGASTQTNAEISNAEHTYAEEGDYHITVTLNRIGYLQDFLNNLLIIGNKIISINVDGAGVINKVKWPLLYTYSLSNNEKSTDYYYVSVAKNNDAAFQMAESGVNTNIVKCAYIGDNTIPYLGFVDTGSFAISMARNLEELYIQCIGADFSIYSDSSAEYPKLKTLKVAPDDLKTFKTAVTAFNKGNTTATLTVLKGKNQEEAYQWATANGHFASIVKA